MITNITPPCCQFPTFSNGCGNQATLIFESGPVLPDYPKGVKLALCPVHYGHVERVWQNAETWLEPDPSHVRRYPPVFITDTNLGCAECGEPIFIGDDDLRLTFAWERLEPVPYTLVHETCRVAYHKRYRGNTQ